MIAVARRRFLPLALLLSSSLAVAADAPFVARDLIGDGAFTHNAEGPAAGPDGALYAVNLGKDGTIARIVLHADGNAKAEVFVTLPEGSTGNGIRFRDGVMYVADYTGHKILRVNMQTRAVAPSPRCPMPMAPTIWRSHPMAASMQATRTGRTTAGACGRSVARASCNCWKPA